MNDALLIFCVVAAPGLAYLAYQWVMWKLGR
jgi:hypothetical protein